MGELEDAIVVENLSISYLEHWRSLTRPWGIPRVIDAIKEYFFNSKKRRDNRIDWKEWCW